jgi:murein L,D-transpeptidase YcbB/YkuD
MNQLATAGDEGTDAARAGAPLQKGSHTAGERDVALSRAFVSYVRALRTPSRRNQIVYIDPELAPATDASALLDAAAAAPSLPAHVRAIRQMHPLYEGLRSALIAYRRDGVNPTDLSGPLYEQRLLNNLDRLRPLPAAPARRYLVVDTASARLWLYDGRKIVHEMPVIVGRVEQQTPSLAGLIRYSALNPYWNLPPDLVRTRAGRIARGGAGLLEQEKLELLSDWSNSPRTLAASDIDWGSVANGTAKLRMRQKPGSGNMMGAVKFMLPNRLGIYLHDTPDKSAFAKQDRRLSSGCVRLADASLLYRWLMRGKAMTGVAAPETHVPLPQPVPVYILYLTALPSEKGIVLQDDVYRRDSHAAYSS